MDQLQAIINRSWEQRSSGLPTETRSAVEEVLQLLTDGVLRSAAPTGDGKWVTHEWVKKAILLHFAQTSSRVMRAGELSFYDKVETRRDWEESGVRVVPPATVRHGAHVARGAILMPCYVNIGAFVGSGTMIDTWSTVGSCAQVGANCHISGGVGIGGVLEPLQASPVIIEDNCFIGARSEVAEGVFVGEGAVLAMGSYVSQSTKIYDAVNGGAITRGRIPPRAVVVPGALPSPDGTHSTYALIIKKYRDDRTDAKTALNDILR
ncbi:2,3,4,5-tetrahydropyridine-2,6-dicarboxylate N-succinyltransferase [bacterium]|nr:2,3,4,5-tetrahydropyridine-2,6-dicarboxylate N-succinyltransferase [bacterium]